MKKLRWEINDWLWLVGFLIIIILYLFTKKFAQDQDFISYISFASNGISIALAFTAIIVSTIQYDSSLKLSREMDITLAKLDEKVDLTNGKMENMETAFNEFYNNFSLQIDKTLNEEDASKLKTVLDSELKRISILDKKINFLNDYIYRDK
ncbi:MAG TPA: hypothetical protein VEF53_07825 [Patescibacteria group bacterium]|nr:hypothetical protein [Patescibacteria group bacterium]